MTNIFLIVLCLSWMMGGCTLTPEVLTQEEIESRASKDRTLLTEGQEPVGGGMDASDLIMPQARRFTPL